MAENQLTSSAASLAGKRVVVLGGTSGIGFATAAAAVAAGAHVVVASKQPARLDEATQRLGPHAEGHALDLTHDAQVRDFFAQVGTFDHLVVTAGDPLLLGEFVATELSAMRQALEVRYFGALTAVKYAQPHLRPGGSIVLTSGAAGLRPSKGMAVVASLCGAVEALVRALAVELAPLRVNAVAPGMVRTEVWEGVPEAHREAMFASAGQRVPVGYVASAADLAKTYLYLMQQSYVTGQTLVVDGGSVLV